MKILWFVCSLYSLICFVFLLAQEGKVNNWDRLVVFLCLTPVAIPLSVMLTVCFLMEGLSWVKEHRKFMAWRIERKIRARRKGPLVRLVEYLHNRRKETPK